MPVTTLHTVLKDPTPEYRDVMCKLSDLSDKLVVMSHKAYDFLKGIYDVPRIKLPLSITAFRIPRPRHSYVENIKAITNFELPEIKLDHLKAFTDDTGILQHANYTGALVNQWLFLKIPDISQ